MATIFKQVKNNAKSIVNLNALNNTNGTTTIGVEDGSRFPMPGNGFYVTVWNVSRYFDPSDDPNMRIGLCTARSGNDLTITWGQQGTPINAIKGRPMVALLIIDQLINDITSAVNTLENSVVYTSGNQSVSGNKTFTGALTVSNTQPTINLTETDQTSPAGVYRFDVSNDQLRIVRSSSVLGYFDANGFNANSRKISNVLAGTTNTDAVNYGQVVNKQDKVTVTVGTSSSGYTTDGIEDDIQLNAALLAVHNAGGGIVEITSPLTIKRTITMYADVHILSHGDETPVKISSDFLAGVAFFENSGAAHGLTTIDLTVDVSAKTDVGGIHVYQGNYVRMIRPHITGQKYSSSSKWALRIGNYTSGDPAGTASHGMYLENPRIDNCNCGTFEQMLIVNQQDYTIIRPYFESNTNSLAYELTCYINNKNGVIVAPHFETPSAHSICVQQSDGIQFFGVTANHSNDFKLVTITNSQNVYIDGITAKNTLSTATTPSIEFFDRGVGPDGFTQIVPDTNNVVISNIMIDGWKYLASAQTGGTISGTPYTMNQYNITFQNVLMKNILSVPFLIGIDNAANNLHDWDFDNIRVQSWNGINAGAFQLRGYSSGVTQMYNFRLNRVKIPPSSGVGSNAAVRAIGMQVEYIKESDISGVFPTYGALSLVSSGSVNEIVNTKGINPNKVYDQGNVTGATTFTRSNGSTINATATGNITTTIPNGFVKGSRLTLNITQDATGGRTISKPTNVRLLGGAFTPTATANALDSWTLEWDGSNYWNEVSRTLNIVLS